MNRSADPVWRAVQAGAVLLVLALFLFQLRELLTPFVAFWLLVAVLLPYRGTDGYRLLVSVAAVLTLFWILDTTGFLLAPFVLAVVLAYVVDPLVDRLEGWGVPRSPAILLLSLPVLGAAVVGIVVGIPALGHEVTDFIDRAPRLLERVVVWLEGLRAGLVAVDLPLVDEDALLRRLRTVDAATVTAFLEERREAIARRSWRAVLGLGRGLGSILTVAGYVVLTPVLTYYLLRDYDGMMARIGALLPRDRREGIVAFARAYDDLLSRYLRGQITVALLVGLVTGVGLWILGFPHALLVGAVAGVFNVVPYLGLVASLIPALVIALTSGSILLSVGKIALVYAVAQGLEGTLISPRIVGESVGLHPVWVMLALTVGGFFFGFVGLLIAMPLAVLVKLLLVRGVERYRASPFYRGTEADAAAAE